MRRRRGHCLCCSTGALSPRCYPPGAGAVIDLNMVLGDRPECELTMARDINNDGIIVGEGVVRGSSRAFVLTPLI